MYGAGFVACGFYEDTTLDTTGHIANEELRHFTFRALKPNLNSGSKPEISFGIPFDLSTLQNDWKKHRVAVVFVGGMRRKDKMCRDLKCFLPLGIRSSNYLRNDFAQSQWVRRVIKNIEVHVDRYRLTKFGVSVDLSHLEFVPSIKWIVSRNTPISYIYPLPHAEFLQFNLSGNGLPRPKKQPYLKAAYYDQKEVGYPRSPIENVIPKGLLLVGDGNGRQAGEFYGVLFILGCYGAAMFLGGTGLYWFFDEGRRWSGGCLIASALTLALVGTLSGGFNCLPWHWGQCSRQHSEYRQTFEHDGENVSQKSLAATWEPVRASDMAKRKDFSWLLIIPFWVALMSGALSLVREIAATFYPDKIPPSQLFRLCSWGAFVVSAAWAWWIEHAKFLKEQDKNEGSRVEGQLFVGVVDSKRTTNDGQFEETSGCYVTILLTAANLNPPPAHLDRYATQLSLQIKERSYEGKYEVIPTERIEFVAEIPEIHNCNVFDFFSALFRQFPMLDGEQHQGWLRFYFEELRQSQFEGKSEVSAIASLKLKDTRSKIHCIRGDVKLHINKMRHRSEPQKL